MFVLHLQLPAPPHPSDMEEIPVSLPSPHDEEEKSSRVVVIDLFDDEG